MHWCNALRCNKLQELRFLFSEVFRVKGLFLLYFHHANKDLNHPDTLSFV
jgi:hypothetical protein